MKPFTLGLDIGTTSVKALALGADGVVLGRTTSHHGIAESAGVVEIDPGQWWSSVWTAVSELAAGNGGLGAVEGIGLSGNMSSVVLLDETLNPLLPAVLLPDPRGTTQLAELPERVAARITAATGNQPSSVFSLSTLLWLRDTAPHLIAAARTWLSAKDYVRMRLTGVIGTEITDAYNTLLIDRATGTWDLDLIRDMDLPPRIFPELHRSGAIVGTVAAETCGIPAGVPVIAGLADMAAAILGSTDPKPGELLVSLGTSVTTITCVNPGGFAPQWSGRLTFHPLPAEPGAFALGSLLTGGLALNWIRARFGADAISAAAGPLAPDDPLVFLPHLAGIGTPDFVPAARGSLLGVRPSTTGADIARALNEAIGCELANVSDLLGTDFVRTVTLSGGGTQLPGLVSAIAGVLDRPVDVAGTADASALGAARLAWQALGEPCPIAGHSRRVPPDHRDIWAERRGRYQRARELTLAYYLGTSAP